jgi:hypothetical protein
MRKLRGALVVALIAAVAAAGMYWLSSDFRPDGILGTLQISLQPLVFFPYIVGAIFGGNAHEPNSVAFASALFVQFFTVFALISRIWRRMRDRG